ncbi:MAG TPA: hypothetical protein VNK95_23950 [Caldilineaceae bacterium]|nr:hypothetical protein [Caldilineaceae bacterium]
MLPGWFTGLDPVPQALLAGVFTWLITALGTAALAMAIGLQNFPEGIAVAMPLRRAGVSQRRSFFYGQLSAAVEPAAVSTVAMVVAMVAYSVSAGFCYAL